MTIYEALIGLIRTDPIAQTLAVVTVGSLAFLAIGALAILIEIGYAWLLELCGRSLPETPEACKDCPWRRGLPRRASPCAMNSATSLLLPPRSRRLDGLAGAGPKTRS